ncbi:MAG: polyprenyl diphosphate synthase [Candidatus Bathyarchaeia archaeon]
MDDEQDRLNVLDELYRVYVECGPVCVKASEVSDRLDLDPLAMEKALHWLEGHNYIEWSSTKGELSITALGIDVIEKARQEKQNKTVVLAKPFGQSVGLMEMEADFRKHLLAILELGIKYSEDAGLTQTRLSELEHRLGLSRNTMREAIKYLGERGLARIVAEDSRLPYGITQAFVTDTGKLYYHELLDESGEKVEKTGPVEIQDSIKLFKKDHPDATRVGFIMMKFKHTFAHDIILKSVKDTLGEHGLEGVRSDDHEYHKDLFYNVETYMHGCGFGIAIYDRIEEEEFSPNVSLEVGYMMALGKHVCLLKDKNLQTLHADLLGKLYKSFDPQDPEKTIPDELSKWLYDKKIVQLEWLEERVGRGEIPKHVGVIVGNSQLALTKNRVTYGGFVEWCYDLGVRIVTLYVFPMENFNRSKQEVDTIFGIIEEETRRLLKAPRLHQDKVRVKAVGRLDLLPKHLQDVLQEIEHTTESYDRHFLNIALAYGGRTEIIDAARKIASDVQEGSVEPEEIDEHFFMKYLYTAHLPNPYPDLVIRTSGEERLSGFLLWQAAYNEFCFLDVYWPEFRKIDFLGAIRTYQQRRREFAR